MQHNMHDLDVEFSRFVKHFLTGRINWRAIPRQNAIYNFGNIISLVVYRHDQYQVELFIAPKAPSTFTPHTHPHVDVVEFGLTGHVLLNINNMPVCTVDEFHAWQRGEMNTVPVHILPTAIHSGQGVTPYAFLSLQHWLNGVAPTSVGLNWHGDASSVEQQAMWTVDSSVAIKV